MGGVLVQLRQRAEDAEQRAERLREMVELAEKLGDEGIAEFVAMVASDEATGNGHNNGNGHDEKKVPRGREAVREIVATRPGIWTMVELRAEMKRREWFTSNKGVDVAVSRLCSSGEARRIGRGRYEFSDAREEDAIESDPSDGAMIPLRQ